MQPILLNRYICNYCGDIVYSEQRKDHKCKEPTAEKALIEINCDTVREMRMKGRPDIAKKMLETFHKDKEKYKREAFNDYRRQYRLKKQTKGLCKQEGCYEKLHKWGFCEKHNEMRRKSKIKRDKINKELIEKRKCIICNKKHLQIYSKTHCEWCIPEHIVKKIITKITEEKTNGHNTEKEGRTRKETNRKGSENNKGTTREDSYKEAYDKAFREIEEEGTTFKDLGI